MFDINDYYEKAHSGERVDNTEVLTYIKSFDHVIIWGGSYLGHAVGKYLIGEGVNIEHYWDIRYQELETVNGINVIEPFSEEKKDNTLVILCIANNVLISKLLYKLKSYLYKDVLRGDYLYEGAICRFSKETDIYANQCFGSMECRAVYCKRLGNIVKSKAARKDTIHFTSITLVVNQICSLKCKYCTSYMNEYKGKDRKNFSFDRIANDIDLFFDAVDTVGTITVMGGEPFMHPDIGKIIEKLCEKNNFGLISIATSGTYPIQPEQLEGLHDKRVNVSFSNYTCSINDKQKELFYKNIELVKQSGVNYTVGLVSPEWIVPPTLYDKQVDQALKIERRNSCINYHQLKNGKIHPCDFATAIYSLGVADYPTDYVDLTVERSREELRKCIVDYLNRDYYESCGHHVVVPEDAIKGKFGMTAMAAEQGYLDFKKPLSSTL